MRRRFLFLFVLVAMDVSVQRANAQSFECGYKPPDEWRAAFAAGVAEGLIPDPKTKLIPEVVVAPEILADSSITPTCVTVTVDVRVVAETVPTRGTVLVSKAVVVVVGIDDSQVSDVS